MKILKKTLRYFSLIFIFIIIIFIYRGAFTLLSNFIEEIFHTHIYWYKTNFFYNIFMLGIPIYIASYLVWGFSNIFSHKPFSYNIKSEKMAIVILCFVVFYSLSVEADNLLPQFKFNEDIEKINPFSFLSFAISVALGYSLWPKRKSENDINILSITISYDYIKQYFDKLNDEFIIGYNYLKIYKNLIRCKKNFIKEYNIFPEFFSKYEIASLELAYISLFKILEKSNSKNEYRPINIHDLLNYLNIYIEDKKFDNLKDILKKIKKDKYFLSPKNNLQIKKILELRNKSIAHLDKSYLINNSKDKSEFLIFSIIREPDLIDELYKKIGNILKYYSKIIFNQDIDIFSIHINFQEEKKLFIFLNKCLYKFSASG